MTNFNDTSDDLHPFDCKGPTKCIHCDRKKTENHNPQICSLCHETPGGLRNPITQEACGHITGKLKWGISGSVRWCDDCKKFVQLEIDWDGHP